MCVGVQHALDPITGPHQGSPFGSVIRLGLGMWTSLASVLKSHPSPKRWIFFLHLVVLRIHSRF